MDDKINPIVTNCNEIPDIDMRGGAARPTPITPLLITSIQPCAETVNPQGLTDDPLLNLQHGFDFYSWLTFLALNSPADGTPLLQGANSHDTLTKWEDIENYRQLADVMLPDGRRPVWGAPIVPPECRSEYKPGMMIIKIIEESFNQPFKTGPLIDQNGNYAIFDILMNKPMFKYTTENGLYSKVGQQAFGERVAPPSGNNPGPDKSGRATPGRMGAVMLKVSWKILDGNDDPHKFHVVQALVDVPNFKDAYGHPTCVRKTLGLVGFHVGHKTRNRPQWIWTTFEHVDNVPEQSDVDSKLKLQAHYNFYNPACDSAECPANQTPPRPWGLDDTLKFHSAFRSQIVRTTSLFDDARELNQAFQSILGGTAWENYMLVSTQWPSDFECATSPDPTHEVDLTCAPAPTFLANTTLETYSQAGKGLVAAKLTADLPFEKMNATSFTAESRPRDPMCFEWTINNEMTTVSFGGAGHLMGTYRMGTDPRKSVVDSDQRSWDHPDLFLVGSGVFPTTATANPTLTLAALVLRTAEAILNKDLG